MDVGITENFDPLLLAREGRRISGELLLLDLPRLADLSSEPASGRISVNLQFNCDEDQNFRLQGTAHGELNVICQRCLEQMPLTISGEISSLLISHVDSNEETSQEEDDSDSEDALIVCEGKTTVAALIEDDLLLAMPMFAKHAAGSCSNKNGPKRTSQEEDKKENPFAVLAVLKSGNSGNKTGKK